MKKDNLLFLVLCAFIFSCKGNSGANQAATDTATKLNYPFTPKYSINWKPGDEKNAVIVLNCLKNILQAM